MKSRFHIVAIFFLLAACIATTGRAQDANIQMPISLVPGAKVITLWPPDAPTLKHLDQKEAITWTTGQPDRVQKITNINNPSIEIHLAPADKATGAGIIVAAGGGNRELNVGSEGTDVAVWLNSNGVSAFVLRYRLMPYSSAVDALADTQRSIRIVRAHAQEWGIAPDKIGIIGFSAGGEQAARVAVNFDAGNTEASDAIEKQSDRPDFVVMVYPGWRELDLSHVPKNAPPTFIMCAGVDDAFHARDSVDFYNALFNQKVPVELHIYGHGGHGGGLRPRNGIPMGTWQYRFLEWAADLGELGPKK